MPYQILVLQYGHHQGIGRFFSRPSGQPAVHLHVVDLLHQPVPDFAGFDALIALCGAAHGASRAAARLAEGRRALQAWVALDRPCLGLGGGHLLLAEVIGAGIGANFVPSIGFTSGHLTHDGRAHPLFAGFDTPFPLFKWHDRSIKTPVPRSILLLATSCECVVEAFCGRGRPHIIGIQFENYRAHPDDVAARVQRDHSWFGQQRPGPAAVDRLLQDARRHRQEVEESFAVMMRNFIGLLGS